MSSKLVKFILSIGVCQLAGVIGGLLNTLSVRTWYQEIDKPSFTPPDWVFAPVWISLYLLMGVSLYLVWSADTTPGLKQSALILFFLQLILNSAWTFFFFYLQNPLYGFIEILILLVFIVLTAVRFYTIRPWAAFLLVPYLLWVGFAAFLNYSIWNLNR